MPPRRPRGRNALGAVDRNTAASRHRRKNTTSSNASVSSKDSLEQVNFNFLQDPSPPPPAKKRKLPLVLTSSHKTPRVSNCEQDLPDRQAALANAANIAQRRRRKKTKLLATIPEETEDVLDESYKTPSHAQDIRAAVLGPSVSKQLQERKATTNRQEREATQAPPSSQHNDDDMELCDFLEDSLSPEVQPRPNSAKTLGVDSSPMASPAVQSSVRSPMDATTPGSKVPNETSKNSDATSKLRFASLEAPMDATTAESKPPVVKTPTPQRPKHHAKSDTPKTPKQSKTLSIPSPLLRASLHRRTPTNHQRKLRLGLETSNSKSKMNKAQSKQIATTLKQAATKLKSNNEAATKSSSKRAATQSTSKQVATKSKNEAASFSIYEDPPPSPPKKSSTRSLPSSQAWQHDLTSPDHRSALQAMMDTTSSSLQGMSVQIQCKEDAPSLHSALTSDDIQLSPRKRVVRQAADPPLLPLLGMAESLEEKRLEDKDEDKDEEEDEKEEEVNDEEEEMEIVESSPGSPQSVRDQYKMMSSSGKHCNDKMMSSGKHQIKSPPPPSEQTQQSKLLSSVKSSPPSEQTRYRMVATQKTVSTPPTGPAAVASANLWENNAPPMNQGTLLWTAELAGQIPQEFVFGLHGQVYQHPILPPGWELLISESRGRPFYHHPDFGSTFTCPIPLPCSQAARTRYVGVELVNSPGCPSSAELVDHHVGRWTPQLGALRTNPQYSSQAALIAAAKTARLAQSRESVKDSVAQGSVAQDNVAHGSSAHGSRTSNAKSEAQESRASEAKSDAHGSATSVAQKGFTTPTSHPIEARSTSPASSYVDNKNLSPSQQQQSQQQAIWNTQTSYTSPAKSVPGAQGDVPTTIQVALSAKNAQASEQVAPSSKASRDTKASHSHAVVASPKAKDEDESPAGDVQDGDDVAPPLADEDSVPETYPSPPPNDEEVEAKTTPDAVDDTDPPLMLDEDDDSIQQASPAMNEDKTFESPEEDTKSKEARLRNKISSRFIPRTRESPVSDLSSLQGSRHSAGSTSSYGTAHRDERVAFPAMNLCCLQKLETLPLVRRRKVKKEKKKTKKQKRPKVTPGSP